MKRMLSFMLVLVFSIGATACFAYPALDRVQGGLKDILISPLQVTDNVKTEMKVAKFMPFGIVGGTTKGTFYMAKQIVDGAWAIASTPYSLVKK